MNGWKDKIRRDIVPFANPGSKVEFSELGSRFHVQWKARSRSFSAFFELCEGKLEVDFESRRMSYAAFLSSSSMSDMLGIASMMLQMHHGSIYIDTQAKNIDLDESPRSALSVLGDAILSQEEGSTSVLFINADAGAGKTEVLKQLVFDQANRYLRGETDFLYLYVNAQGRALARLEEALATEIQDLRATNLTYHVIPTLTRNKVIIPIIDGFDELLGVMGYEDSFSSLRRFLVDLQGQGCLIASARSTYFQQEFLSRANRASSGLGGITISQIDVQPWSHNEFIDFLGKRFVCDPNPRLSFDRFSASMMQIFAAKRNSDLKTKPFFLAAAATLILQGAEINEDDLIDQLVGGFIERERSEKLLDKNGNPLLSSEQIQQFLRMISDEMWAGEVRALDRETVRELADLAFDSMSISTDTSQILQERAGTMAFFTAGTHRDGIEFEHQLFFAYFLGEGIASSAVANQDELFRTFVRATLPEGAAAFAARRLVQLEWTALHLVGECNAVAGRGTIRPPHLRENAGALIVEFMRFNSHNDDETSNNLYFKNVVFAGLEFPSIKLVASSFKDVEFRRSNLSLLKVLKSQGDNLIFQDVTINTDITVLDIDGISLGSSVFGLRTIQDGRVQPLFRFSDVRAALAKCNFPGTEDVQISDVDEKALALIERLLKKFVKSNVFWPTDDSNRAIILDEKWEKLSDILISSEVVVQERVSDQSGAHRPHLRITVPAELVMSGQSRVSRVPAKISLFWNEVRRIWPTD